MSQQDLKSLGILFVAGTITGFITYYFNEERKRYQKYLEQIKE